MRRGSVVDEVFARHRVARTGMHNGRDSSVSPSRSSDPHDDADRRRPVRTQDDEPEPDDGVLEGLFDTVAPGAPADAPLPFPCDVLKGDEGPNAPPFDREITQAVAYEMWNLPDSVPMGRGIAGETRLCSWKGRRVIVKEASLDNVFAHNYMRWYIEARRQYDQDPGNPFLRTAMVEAWQLTARGQAMNEERMHREAYRRMDARCRRFVTIPACMAFEPFVDPDTRSERLFTVQSLAEPSFAGGETMSAADWGRYLEANAAEFKSKNAPGRWERFLSEVGALHGTMTGCFHRAGIVHNDLHTANILVHWLGSPTHNLDEVRFEMTTIDWGRARDHWSFLQSDPNNGVLTPCYTFDNKRRKDKPWDLERQVAGVTLANEPRCVGEFYYFMEMLQRLVVHMPIRAGHENEDFRRIDAADWRRVRTLMNAYRSAYEHELDQGRVAM